tara:strand:- start:877 stop:1323 length:447 start_codon:yes stop_codon:yes gene_type:complete
MAVNYNLEAQQGANFTFHVKYLDENNSPVDLAGMTASMQVRRYATSSTKLIEWASHNVGSILYPLGVTTDGTGGSGGIKLNATYTGGTASILINGMTGSTGGIYVTADPETMSHVPVGKHYYDLELINGNTILRIVEGRFEVKGNVSR